MGASTFPELPIIWKRRDPGLPGLAEHYVELIKEVEEEYVAIAHDDEIYSDHWLEFLTAEMKAEVVLSFGQKLIVDARTQPPAFHAAEGQLLPGIHTSEALKKFAIFDSRFFPGHGFLTRSALAKSTAHVLLDYEQYDYALLMRIAEKGSTVVRPEALSTYTVHRTNTLGSREYMLEYARRKQACAMMLEWLDELKIPKAVDCERRSALWRAYAAGDFRTVIRSVGIGERPISMAIVKRLEANPQSGWIRTLFARLATAPGLFAVLKYGLKVYAAWRKVRHSPLPQRRLSFGELQALFPEVLRSGMEAP
jgi:hypothetical protein